MDKLETRKESLLNFLVREYVKTAEPVGSLLLAEKSGLAVSPATIRNELASLETDGFLEQPHTSAGRIPTERAYRYFVEHLAGQSAIDKTAASELRKSTQAEDERGGIKSTAKCMSQIANECVFVSFGPHDVYYTGLSTFFSKPEFSSQDVAISLTSVLDRLDEMVDALRQELDSSPRALIGSENPFGKICSTVFTGLGSGRTPHMIGFFGLLRMDYEQDLELLNLVNKYYGAKR